MHLYRRLSFILLSFVLLSTARAYVPESTNKTDLLALKSLRKLTGVIRNGQLKRHLATQNVQQHCDADHVAVRKEYSALTDAEKLEYIRAVKCLMDAPSNIPPGIAPGAKSRYDDFVAVHIIQTPQIHFSGWFLAWHRAYIYSFERALRDECAFQAYLPYWNWGKSAYDPLNSPYMDGSITSQGGNGVWSPHNCTYPGANPDAWCIPVVEGRGGGCVESGPYVGYMANLSATQPVIRAPDAPVGDKVNILRYTPRCLRRDISPELSTKFATDAESYDLLNNPNYQTSLAPFQDHLEGFPLSISSLGLHGAGHYVFGGDPGGDVFNSPNDPLFWLHHTQLDRTWWIWQNQQPTERAFQIHGTRTMLNDPPSSEATIEDIMDMSWITPRDMKQLSIKHHVSSAGGPYCYVYE